MAASLLLQSVGRMR